MREREEEREALGIGSGGGGSMYSYDDDGGAEYYDEDGTKRKRDSVFLPSTASVIQPAWARLADEEEAAMALEKARQAKGGCCV